MAKESDAILALIANLWQARSAFAQENAQLRADVQRLEAALDEMRQSPAE